MNIQAAVSTCMSKYATFSGRASRSEFWWFQLAVVVFGWGLQISSSNMLGQKAAAIASLIYSLAAFIPQIAVGSRRLHDIGKSGWWQLLLLTGIGFLPLVFWWAKPTHSESNRFGDIPEDVVER
ncbi:DUF805 domain-containing protein [Xanthobacter oligotrophicus]|uniref:DUF805 domain-containing protein n=1 Tax=Xanthobacter oligotrophicus TaxID=2607286 RepID=UPI001EE553E2|nr:DUF805 domain-containing protein [Xanthobacter oligotrophicus]MCG5238123.1 DUF805 domain-containing protein [Xanthobacter oligotrophicus]